MITVKLSGEEHELRCDLNVVEKIEDKFGTIAALYQEITRAAVLKWLIAELINEARAVRGVAERVTEDEAGRLCEAEEIIPALVPVIEALNSCCTTNKPKNAESGETTTG